MITRSILVGLLCVTGVYLPGAVGGAPWEKVPEKWSLADVARILQDSPWSPASVKVKREFAAHQTDPQTRITTDAPVNSDNANQIPGIQISRSKPHPKFPVIWWSSKTVRLAEQRLLQLRSTSGNSALSGEALRVEELPDYVLVIVGSEALRILEDANEDLHDTVFLELANGATLELASVRFIGGAEPGESGVEFHFAKEIEGRATLDPESERVVFHCKASAKTLVLGRDNSLALRVEFRPRAMQVHGVPDL